MTNDQTVAEAWPWQGVPMPTLLRALDAAYAESDFDRAQKIVDQIYRFYDDRDGRGTEPAPDRGPGRDGDAGEEETMNRAAGSLPVRQG